MDLQDGFIGKTGAVCHSPHLIEEVLGCVRVGKVSGQV